MPGAASTRAGRGQRVGPVTIMARATDAKAACNRSTARLEPTRLLQQRRAPVVGTIVPALRVQRSSSLTEHRPVGRDLVVALVEDALEPRDERRHLICLPRQRIPARMKLCMICLAGRAGNREEGGGGHQRRGADDRRVHTRDHALASSWEESGAFGIYARDEAQIGRAAIEPVTSDEGSIPTGRRQEQAPTDPVPSSASKPLLRRIAGVRATLARI